MELISHHTYTNAVVRLDDTKFCDCTFIDCTLEYEGGYVIFERSIMRRCRYVFSGQARRTVQFCQNTGLMPWNASEWAELPELVH